MEEIFGDAWKHLHVGPKEIENASEKVFFYQNPSYQGSKDQY